jgi:hypothetical protein
MILTVAHGSVAFEQAAARYDPNSIEMVATCIGFLRLTLA